MRASSWVIFEFDTKNIACKEYVTFSIVKYRKKHSVFSEKNEFPVMIFQKVYDLVFGNGIYKTSKNNSLVTKPQGSIPAKFIICTRT